ncbi:MobA/MobL family protein [Stakelama marina]|uniref:MobA/MobL family protein n=1 Tax=Stakelama marina TaxID=2826939 RepID=A0A8T4IKW7_9SPHN|nr:MobA/MobL family protein [Stakelama marina]MBR0553765.1 MobA/MobL family protein [Stakelama marina]
MSIHIHRPFNIRYVVWNPVNARGEDVRSTHRTGKCSYCYIHRLHGIDDVGPMPDWSHKQDLVMAGRCGPKRSQVPELEGVALWEKLDAAAKQMRPSEAIMAHCVGSLPEHEGEAVWREMVEGFLEDHIAAQGMVADWAVHYRVDRDDRPGVHPHAHMLITTRVYDPSSPEFGKRRQNWLRTPAACRSLAEKWYAITGIYPPGNMLMPIAA